MSLRYIDRFGNKKYIAGGAGGSGIDAAIVPYSVYEKLEDKSGLYFVEGAEMEDEWDFSGSKVTFDSETAIDESFKGDITPTEPALMQSGSTLSNLFSKVARLYKNVRYLFGKVDNINNTLNDNFDNGWLKNKNLAHGVSYYNVGQYGRAITLAENFKFKNGVTYTISFDTTNTGAQLYFYEYDKTTQRLIWVIADGTRKYLTVTMTQDVLAWSIILNRSTINSGVCSNLQIEEGSTPTTYVVGNGKSNRELSENTVTYADYDTIKVKTVGEVAYIHFIGWKVTNKGTTTFFPKTASKIRLLVYDNNTHNIIRLHINTDGVIELYNLTNDNSVSNALLYGEASYHCIV